MLLLASGQPDAKIFLLKSALCFPHHQRGTFRDLLTDTPRKRVRFQPISLLFRFTEKSITEPVIFRRLLRLISIAIPTHQYHPMKQMTGSDA